MSPQHFLGKGISPILLAMLISFAASAAWTPPVRSASTRTRHAMMAAPVTSEVTDTAEPEAETNPRAKLIAGLQREYDSFFQPMEEDLYTPDVGFQDPMISLSGVDAFKENVNMLAGKTMLGKTCFSDCGLIMHNITELSNGGLETRWTLQFRFRLLPWQPLAQFTGVSRYTLDSSASKIAQQDDFWDSVNLLPGGNYAPTSKLAGFADLLGQLAPSDGNKAQQASSKELPYVLLRRAASKDGMPGYEVRRYPQHVSVATQYYRRLDAFGTLGAYTNGANEADQELKPYVPSLMSVPYDDRTLEQVTDDSLDLKPPEYPKFMRWPMAVPAMGEGAPAKPNERLVDVASLELMPSKTVAVLAFSDPTTEPNVRGFHGLLSKYLREDGLVPSKGEDKEQFRLAQFDALNSFGARRSEIWIDLEEHPW